MDRMKPVRVLSGLLSFVFIWQSANADIRTTQENIHEVGVVTGALYSNGHLAVTVAVKPDPCSRDERPGGEKRLIKLYFNENDIAYGVALANLNSSPSSCSGSSILITSLGRYPQGWSYVKAIYSGNLTEITEKICKK